MYRITKIILFFSFSLLAMQAFANRQIDLLIFYSDEMLSSNYGNSLTALKVDMSNRVAYTNQAYKNSGMDLSIKIIGFEKWSNPEGEYPTSAALRELEKSADVFRIANQYKPHLIMQIGESGDVACGIGSKPLSASPTPSKDYARRRVTASWGGAHGSIVASECSANTFAHELGHNLGAGHGVLNEGSLGIPYANNRGYGVPGEFVTVMIGNHNRFGYENAPILQYFSKDGLNKCKGMSCGDEKASASDYMPIVYDRFVSHYDNCYPVQIRGDVRECYPGEILSSVGYKYGNKTHADCHWQRVFSGHPYQRGSHTVDVLFCSLPSTSRRGYSTISRRSGQPCSIVAYNGAKLDGSTCDSYRVLIPYEW